jgi:8-oxo-dGTP diphosphatase
MTNHVHVAVATIIDDSDNVLLAFRQFNQHQGNLWEFPGGKVEEGETVFQALQREISEEVGLKILSGKSLLKIQHDYGDKSVLLDVWHVEDYEGVATGLEGQALEWCAIDMLNERKFPEANVAIISALQALR